MCPISAMPQFGKAARGDLIAADDADALVARIDEDAGHDLGDRGFGAFQHLGKVAPVWTSAPVMPWERLRRAAMSRISRRWDSSWPWGRQERLT
jgi:hypothetical protein